MELIPYLKLSGMFLFLQIYFNIYLLHYFPIRMVLWDAWAYINFSEP